MMLTAELTIVNVSYSANLTQPMREKKIRMCVDTCRYCVNWDPWSLRVLQRIIIQITKIVLRIGVI